MAALFPAGCVAAELDGDGDPAQLRDEEAEHVVRAAPKRAREFAAGRMCARHALAGIGIVDFPLRAAPDRQPLWPATVIGSITHTDGFCAAVAALRGPLLAVGLDSEIVGAVSMDLWPTICTAQELSWLETLPAAERDAAVTLIFSAKEAFYKCQYPLVAEWLDFHDLLIRAVDWGAPSAAFHVHVTRPVSVGKLTALPVPGRYLLHDRYLSAGVAIQ